MAESLDLSELNDGIVWQSAEKDTLNLCKEWKNVPYLTEKNKLATVLNRLPLNGFSSKQLSGIKIGLKTIIYILIDYCICTVSHSFMTHFNIASKLNLRVKSQATLKARITAWQSSHSEALTSPSEFCAPDVAFIMWEKHDWEKWTDLWNTSSKQKRHKCNTLVQDTLAIVTTMGSSKWRSVS